MIPDCGVMIPDCGAMIPVCGAMILGCPRTILDCGAIIFPCSNALRWNATRRLCLQHQRQSRKAKMPWQSQGTRKTD